MMIDGINLVTMQGVVKNSKTEFMDEFKSYRTRFIILIPIVNENGEMVNVPKWYPVEFYSSYDPKIDDKDDIKLEGSLGSIRYNNQYSFFVSADTVTIINKNNDNGKQ